MVHASAGPLGDRTVAILGFGHQGEAQALNLRDAGARVIVGARPGGGGEARARAHGFEVAPLSDAARRAELAAVLLPDEVIPALWTALLPSLAPATHLVFAHGYALLYGALEMPVRADVVLVSPTAPGHVLRERVARGDRLPAYLAVHQDATRGAWTLAQAYATAIGCAPDRLWRTTVREETEVDLFGEQAVLCGGMNALVVAAFDTLVDAGYAPEMAYLEVVHQLVYLAELLHARGVSGLRDGISSTARFGDMTRGPRVIGAPARAEMRTLLDEIRSGAFAREWDSEARGGESVLRTLVERARGHRIERARLAALGPAPAGTGEAPRGGGSGGRNPARRCPKTD